MAKLKLQPDPTFSAKVEIAVAGGEAAQVVFTFKHRTRDELQAFIKASADRPDVDTILECATAWDLSDPFGRESLDLMVQNFISSPRAVFDKYIEELSKAREKN